MQLLSQLREGGERHGYPLPLENFIRQLLVRAGEFDRPLLHPRLQRVREAAHFFFRSFALGNIEDETDSLVIDAIQRGAAEQNGQSRAILAEILFLVRGANASALDLLESRGIASSKLRRSHF